MCVCACPCVHACITNGRWDFIFTRACVSMWVCVFTLFCTSGVCTESVSICSQSVFVCVPKEVQHRHIHIHTHTTVFLCSHLATLRVNLRKPDLVEETSGSGFGLREDDGSPTSAGPLPHSGNSISNTHCLFPSVGAVGLGQGWAEGGVVGVDGPSWLGL